MALAKMREWERKYTMATVVALSGSVASGKTTLAKALEERWGGVIISTREVLAKRASERRVSLTNRRDFQEFGDLLDRETGGSWVAEASHASKDTVESLIIIDAVRIEQQVSALREIFGRSLVHVHLETSSREELANRYRKRRGSNAYFEELGSYEEVLENETEALIANLGMHADVVIDTLRNTEKDLLVRCEARLGLLPSLTDPLADVLVGGQYGSEGKGNVSYYLAPEYHSLIRVGGPNAGHKVWHDGKSYTHRSLPSGALSNPHADLIIGPGAVLNLSVLQNELQETGVDPGRVKIDPQVMVITDEDIAAEKDLRRAIQSTGQGAGAAAARRITGRGEPRAQLAKDLPEFASFLHPTADLLHEAFKQGNRVLVEGTQGTGLSLYHGTYPYVTSRDTTVAGALAEVGIGPRRVRRAIMVARTYPIRVNGASGPIGNGNELTWDEIEARSGVEGTEVTELSSVGKKQRRVAEFDWAMLRRSAELNSATDIALTFADYISSHNASAYRYEQLSPATLQFVEEVESVTGASVSLIATSFSDRNIIDRRTWRSGRK
ncbi:adenylosuccinate synthetase [Leucobacter sp. UT-8R-CII-1-4]|uniref:adenylosuccinate synthetase n=1 Tax=Leucobacter sp. UT-8R-CII-1-4 TaxID=3040075 RepID=UPI0024A89C42|nr:adenylosuccinate synthetase [Leucobacter sp. UT-8R-CII-1-4]MDI6024049.1 adenylosuccinate synthetase [Leucobacter sp. UT-8R-CII-1-4]